MIHGFNYPSATALHDGMCRRLMMGTRFNRDFDWVHGTEVGLHNVTTFAPSFEWEFNLRNLWIPRSRWTMMVRQYLNPDELNPWLDLIESRMSSRNGRGLAVLRTNHVQGRGNGKHVRRRFGSCMLNFTFRRNPYPQLSMHSRTTYFGYLAALDITVAYALAKLVAERIGIEPAGMSFLWSIELAQFHGFRSLAWPLMDDEMREGLIDNVTRETRMAIPATPSRPGARPGYRKALDGFARIHAADEAGKLYGDEAFSSFNRVRRRYHTEVYGVDYAEQFAGGLRNVGTFAPLPSVDATTLEIWPHLNGVENDRTEPDEFEDDE